MDEFAYIIGHRDFMIDVLSFLSCQDNTFFHVRF